MKSFVIEDTSTGTGTGTGIKGNKTSSTDVSKNKNSLSVIVSKKSLNTLIQFFLEEKDCSYKLEHKVIDQLYLYF